MWPFQRPRPERRSEKTAQLNVTLDGAAVPIVLKPHASARRMTLRLDRDGEGFVLTVPRRLNRRSAEEFVTQSIDWMRTARARLPVLQPVADGARISVRGVECTVRSTGRVRGLVAIDEESRELFVPGADKHLKRRLKDWLKMEAEADLMAASRRYADAMEVRFTRLSVRDQKSRWGSCNTDGALSYSWRLIMAPSMVLDYVAAHEVAHLREMNHGPRFWRLVLTHCAEARSAKQWLRRNGQMLHRML